MWRSFYQDHFYNRLLIFLLWLLQKVAPWKDDQLSHLLHELAVEYEKEPGENCKGQLWEVPTL